MGRACKPFSKCLLSLRRIKLRLLHISERIKLDVMRHRLVVTRPRLSAMSSKLEIRSKFRCSYLSFYSSRPSYSHRWPFLLGQQTRMFFLTSSERGKHRSSLELWIAFTQMSGFCR